jgi:hypothetical protein
MLQNHRLKHILAAGILTGLVLATVVAFAWRDNRRADANATKTHAALSTSAPEGTDAWRAENEQLRNAFETMRVREKAYQTQLAAANRTISQMQEDATRPRDDDRDEHGEHEHPYGHGKDNDD